ncbi:DeoR family transcriptional regulator, partial [Escherichia coli]|nr:DeoR family transcriptional regulator [Escherichia coli]
AAVYTGALLMRADVVHAVLEKHCEAIILSDSSKFSAVHPYPLGPAGRFNRVITDDRLPDACREQLLRSGLTVDIVPY